MARVSSHFVLDEVLIPDLGDFYLEGVVFGEVFGGDDLDVTDIELDAACKWDSVLGQYDHYDMSRDTQDKITDHLFVNEDVKLRMLLWKESKERPYNPED